MGKAGKDYVHNLQQQIYFLEMETQFLRANAGEEVPTMSLSVDDQMSQLNRSFRDMEEKFRACVKVYLIDVGENENLITA